jgi:hypothetical protein
LELADSRKHQHQNGAAFWALWKVQKEAISPVPPEGQAEKWKALEPRVKAAKGPNFVEFLCHIFHLNVQLRRGVEVSRQAETCNPKKFIYT